MRAVRPDYLIFIFLIATTTTCVTSGFRREVDENFVILGCYAANSGKSLPTFQDNLSVPCSRLKTGHSLEDWTDRLSPIRRLERWGPKVSPKRRQGITTTRCVTAQKSTVLTKTTCYVQIFSVHKATGKFTVPLNVWGI